MDDSELLLIGITNGYLASSPIEPNTTVTIWFIDFIWIEITFSIDTRIWITIFQMIFKKDFNLVQRAAEVQFNEVDR